MFTANQLIAHLIGDYIFQPHFLATTKTKSTISAFIHALLYTLPFILFTSWSWGALIVICVTHALIDRFRLARFVNHVKNGYVFLGKPVTSTGYSEDTPAWLAVWLLIITDNILHIIINALAIEYL